MQVHIARVNGVLFRGEADALNAPGFVGDLTVLPHHVPLVTTLRPGTLSVRAEGREVFRHDVVHGILEVTPEGPTVLL